MADKCCQLLAAQQRMLHHLLLREPNYYPLLAQEKGIVVIVRALAVDGFSGV
jgi:hypothetical protein